MEAKPFQKGSQDPPVTGKTIAYSDGTYSVSVTPQAAGEHELYVTLGGGYVKGSPLKYDVTIPRMTSYSAISCLTFDHQGQLNVVAYSSNCIQVFTPEGTPITSYGSGTLNHPAGIAIDCQGYIAISENGGSNRLWIYNPDNNLVRTLSNQFSSGGRGITCDKDGSFWVADNGNHHITKY